MNKFFCTDDQELLYHSRYGAVQGLYSIQNAYLTIKVKRVFPPFLDLPYTRQMDSKAQTASKSLNLVKL